MGIKKFTFPENIKNNELIIQEENILENKGKILYNVFSKEECDWLINLFDNSDYYHITQDEKSNYTIDYRDNFRIIKDSRTLANIIYNRINDYIEDEIIINNENDELTKLGLTNFYRYNGLWKKNYINYRFRLCKYEEGGHFEKHRDKDYIHPTKKYKSFKTCMIYLNDNFDGGETIFYDNDNNIIKKIKPKQGMILLFNHLIDHKGEKVYHGEKYIARTEIMYEKIN